MNPPIRIPRDLGVESLRIRTGTPRLHDDQREEFQAALTHRGKRRRSGTVAHRSIVAVFQRLELLATDLAVIRLDADYAVDREPSEQDAADLAIITAAAADAWFAARRLVERAER